MNKTEACDHIRKGLALLEKDPSRWARGGYVVARSHGMCACVMGAAYMAMKYGHLVNTFDHVEEEAELDEFLDLVGMALGSDMIKGILTANDNMRLDCTDSEFGLFRGEIELMLKENE